MNWAEGYPAESDYTYGYYRQLNPVFARCLLTVAGVAPPAIRTACELGFGQGVSLAMHEAASGATWWGTDFMPAQAEYAQDLAGPRATLAEQGFDAFCARTDLPQFDFICAHGIWSWVSPENRAILVDFLARKLRPGGVFYVSSNTAIGWASLMPFRTLLQEHVRRMSPPGAAPQDAIRDALVFMQGVFGADCIYARQNPMAPAMLDRIAADISAYHAHEYLGDHWNLTDPASLAQELAGAKLTYAGSAAAIDYVPGLDLMAAQRAALDALPRTGFGTTARELIRGTRFRRDYWIKGGRTMPPVEHQAALARLRFVLVEPRADVTHVRPTTHAGEIALPIAAFDPVLDRLADYRPHAVAELAGALGRAPTDVLHALLTLTEVGAVQPAHEDDGTIAAAGPGVQALNARILHQAREGRPLNHLASAITGGATEVPPAHMRDLLAEQDGVPGPGSLPAARRSMLAVQEVI